MMAEESRLTAKCSSIIECRPQGFCAWPTTRNMNALPLPLPCETASCSEAKTQPAITPCGPGVARLTGSAAATAKGTLKTCGATLAVPVRRIVTLHPGDLSSLLFSLPALHALREGFPGAQICAVLRPALGALLESSPFVDEILARPRGGLSKQTALMLQLRQRHFDIAVAFSPSRNSVMLAWSSGAATRVGPENARMDALLTHRVLGEGAFETYGEMTRSLGCKPAGEDYHGLLTLPPQAPVAAAKLLEEKGVDGPFVVAAPQCHTRRGSTIRRWTGEHWRETVEQLSTRLPIVLVGAQPSPQLMKGLNNPHIVDLGGAGDLVQTAAIMGMARVFIGIDSGLMHLAAALGTPVVGIFGPTDWRKNGPRGATHRIVHEPVECAPCELQTCKWSGADERKCLTQLSPPKVVEAVRELIGV
jgi:ADP-heptose:LPS heptosyltransferase